MRFLTILALFLSLGIASSLPAYAENRTANRTAVGAEKVDRQKVLNNRWASYKKALYNKKHRHPKQWDGQQWDTILWPENWTPETVLYNMYESNILSRQYMDKNRPVVDVGPTFYKLSELDQQRCIKLLVDYFGVLEQGYLSVIVKDWRSRWFKKKTIGRYSKNGLTLY